MTEKNQNPYALIFKLSNSDQFGHGGQKRAYQIEKLINEVLETKNIFFNHSHPLIYSRKSKVKAYKNFFKNRWYKALLTGKSRLSWFHNEVCRMDILNDFLKENEELIKGASVILWEATFPYYLYLPILIRQYSVKKIIACPQNLESLVRGQYINWYSHVKALRLDQEVRSLAHCDFVFAIGEEEQWLLNLFDVPARLLPYYPLSDNLNRLLEIRKERELIYKKPKRTEGNFFFILGSAINPPTKAAMIDLLKILNTEETNINTKFILAGFGTEELQGEFATENVLIEGRISNERLNDLLLSCKGVIVPQGFTTGAITRIMELLVAGIPVISDEGTARSYKRNDGLYVYSNKTHLMKLLNSNFDMPILPIAPINEIAQFKESLKFSFS